MMSSYATRVGFSAMFLGAFVLALAGCKRPATEPPSMPPPLVTVVHPIPYQVQSYFEYNGYLDSVSFVEVRARVKGFLNEIHYKEGQEVKTGDKLYTIDPRQYVASVAKSKADIAVATANIANARAQLKLAEAEYNRLKVAGQSASRSELDKAFATVESNKAQIDVAVANKAAAEAELQSAELDLGYTDIRSPIDGLISRTRVTPGNLVGQNEATLLTTIVSVDPIYVYFDAPEKNFVDYQRALQTQPEAPKMMSFPVEIGVATEAGYPHKGQIDFRENRIDTGTGTVRLRGQVPNPQIPPGNVRLLYPGLYSRVRVPNGGPKELLVLPEEALMTGQEGRFVYVIGKDNIVEKRTVSIGANVWRAASPGSGAPPGWILKNPDPKPAPAGGAPGGPPGNPPAPPPPTSMPARSIIAIEKGLEAGDRVIVNGLQKARPGAPVTPDDWQLIPPPQPPKP